MRLKKSVLQRKKGDSLSLVINSSDAGFTGVIHGNPTAAFIIKCLKHNTSEERILAKMKRRFAGDPEEMRADIASIIAELRKADIIED